MEGATHFTDLHVLVLLLLGVVNDSLQLCLLLLELVNLCHNSFGLLDFTFLTEMLCVLVVQVDFCFELIDFHISCILLSCIHFGLINALILIIVSSLRTIFSSGETTLDFLIHLGYHLCQLHNEFILVFSLVVLPIRVITVLFLQEIIMTLFTRPNVCLCVWEEVVRAEGKEVEFANVLVIEVVSASKTNEEWFVAVFAHELV